MKEEEFYKYCYHDVKVTTTDNRIFIGFASNVIDKDDTELDYHLFSIEFPNGDGKWLTPDEILSIEILD